MPTDNKSSLHADPAVFVCAPRGGLFAQHERGVHAVARREDLRLRRIVHRPRQARPEAGAVDGRRQRHRKPGHVQADPVFHEQPRLRHVHAHVHADHLRFRQFLQRRQLADGRRRRTGLVRLPRLAQGNSGRIHQAHRQIAAAAAVVVRPVDEPLHLQRRNNRCATSPPSCARTKSPATCCTWTPAGSRPTGSAITNFPPRASPTRRRCFRI